MRRAINAMAALLMLLSVISCSMFIITPPPSWLEGNWKLLDEDNLQIGECEISGEDITITRTEWEYEEINLMSMAYQNGGWAEADSDRYILYLDFNGSSCLIFQNLGSYVEVQVNSTSSTAYLTMRK